MAETSWLAGFGGLMALIAVGLVMTAVMQSSTAATAVTISAFYAGAISLEQGAALIIGQNIGTATSSAMAAIGASNTAKRLALAYVLFKVIAALIAIAAFPFTAALLKTLSATIDGTTLLAAYHTAYNVIGVAVLLPATQWFTRIVERILPSKETALERALDRSALVSPVIAVETARRVVADVLKTTTASVAAALSSGAGSMMTQNAATAAATLARTQDFLSELKEPPKSQAEHLRMTSTLHALEHAARLVEILEESGPLVAPAEHRLVALCAQAMQAAHTISASITSESALSHRTQTIRWDISDEIATVLAELERTATQLDAMQRTHRATTLASVIPGKLTASDAFTQVDAARRLQRIANHAWRSAAHLLGQGEHAVDGQGEARQPGG
jgi:phosphate:Na+ symporter